MKPCCPLGGGGGGDTPSGGPGFGTTLGYAKWHKEKPAATTVMVIGGAGAAEQTSSSDRGYRRMGETTAHMAAKMIAAGVL